MPFHIWLPEAHVEAPTAGSIILAGLLLKVGTFGMLRFMVPGFDYCNKYYFNFICLVALTSIVYSCLLALRQFDLKKIVAYSSIGHMGFVVIGIFDETLYGITGSLFSMISHGLVSSALFVIVGFLYDRYKTRNIFEYGGLAQVMPLLSVFGFICFLANMGFPLTSNFVGEFLIFIGIAHTNKFVLAGLAISLMLTFLYTMWTYNRVFFGVMPRELKYFKDLSKEEVCVIASIVLLIIILGICPSIILDDFNVYVSKEIILQRFCVNQEVILEMELYETNLENKEIETNVAPVATTPNNDNIDASSNDSHPPIKN